jgi:RNA polymerase primary sigma factor
MSKFNIHAKLTIIEQDSIDKYLQELRLDKTTTPLSRAEQNSLFSQYKMTGDKLIKDRLIKSNLRWVISVAKQYTYTKVKLADLINEGNIGMIEAIDKFDVSRETSFITFATNYIRLAITSYINDVAVDIPQPANRFRINRLIKKALLDLKICGNNTPSDYQLVEYYASIKKQCDPILSVSLLNEVRNNSKDFVSMHTSVSSSSEDYELIDTFKSSKEWNADFEMEKTEKTNILNEYLKKHLNERELEIITMSFGLITQLSMTNEEISFRTGYTRERVGQIIKEGVKKLSKNKNILNGLSETNYSIVS